MGVVLDSSVLIAFERGWFDLHRMLKDHSPQAIAAVTAAELLIGVERAESALRRERRRLLVEDLFSRFAVIPFDLHHARLYAQRSAALTRQGLTIGDRDLQVAVTAIEAGYVLATLNTSEFMRVEGLKLVEVSLYQTRP